MKRALSFIFIFLMLSVNFTVIAENVAADNGKLLIYQVNLFDQLGRLLPNNNSAIGANLQSLIYTERKVLGIPVGWQKIGQYGGGQFQFKAPLGEKAKIIVFWYGKEQYDNVFYLSTDEIINITLPFVPCVPLIDVRAESLGVSSDIHEINTAYYNIKFGQGKNKNEIWIILGSKRFEVPVTLSGHPFKFLAQSPGSIVEGSESFLIWETTKYVSGVKTYKIGDNGLVIVWTYIYADITGEWTKKILESALLGAIAGTIAEPGVGTAIGGLAGGLAAGVAWALKPELVNITANSMIGVVAGYFTPRWFILQGTSGLGTNGTTGTVDMNTGEITSGYYISQNGKYEVNIASNTIQVGYTKFYGDGITQGFSDFEDGMDGWENGTRTKSKSYSGYYSLRVNYTTKPHTRIYMANVIPGHKYVFQVHFMYDDTHGTGGYQWIFTNAAGATNAITIWCGFEEYGKWASLHTSLTYTATENGKVGLEIYYSTDIQYYVYIDDFSYTVIDEKTNRIIFDTSGSDEAVIVKHVFGTIPEIAPVKGKPTALGRKYTMLAVDVSGTDGFIALDWQSRQPTVYYSRLFINTETWKETAWLFFTDDRYGFQNVTFLITEPKNFIYHIDMFQYYALSTPDNWTFTPDWSPTIVNNTMIILPPEDWNGVTLYSMWDDVSYRFSSWWQNIGTWGHLALYGLGLLILFIIILILAPWVITALIKILALIIKGIVKAFGMAAKGAGNLIKSFKRRRRR